MAIRRQDLNIGADTGETRQSKSLGQQTYSARLHNPDRGLLKVPWLAKEKELDGHLGTLQEIRPQLARLQVARELPNQDLRARLRGTEHPLPQTASTKTLKADIQSTKTQSHLNKQKRVKEWRINLQNRKQSKSTHQNQNHLRSHTFQHPICRTIDQDLLILLLLLQLLQILLLLQSHQWRQQHPRN